MGANAIKGNILSARAAYVRKSAGDAVWKQVLGRLPREDQRVLTGPILPMTWYPMELGLRLDDAIAAELSPGDAQRVFLEMGRASADVNLAGAEKVFLRPGDPHFLLRKAPQIYSFYYQVGRRTYEKLSATSAMVRTYEAESVTATDCLTVMGWHVRALELSGAVEARVEHPMCRVHGADHCAYLFSWAGVLPGNRPPSPSS